MSSKFDINNPSLDTAVSPRSCGLDCSECNCRLWTSADCFFQRLLLLVSFNHNISFYMFNKIVQLFWVTATEIPCLGPCISRPCGSVPQSWPWPHLAYHGIAAYIWLMCWCAVRKVHNVTLKSFRREVVNWRPNWKHSWNQQKIKTRNLLQQIHGCLWRLMACGLVSFFIFAGCFPVIACSKRSWLTRSLSFSCSCEYQIKVLLHCRD